jgi:hypothetical protein|nr:MAG TPA: HeH/LEM domain [Caudoviricetes sp.]
MFILNRNNMQIQECHNSDVIKVCTKDTKNYAVAATKEELETAAGMAQKQPETNKDEENINGGQKTDPEGTQGGNPEGTNQQQGTNENGQGNDPEKAQQQNGQGDKWKNLPEEEKLAALEAKKVDELRKIAKAEGIQGYGNMTKDTLVAMIMNH